MTCFFSVCEVVIVFVFVRIEDFHVLEIQSNHSIDTFSHLHTVHDDEVCLGLFVSLFVPAILGRFVLFFFVIVFITFLVLLLVRLPFAKVPTFRNEYGRRE